MGDKWVTVSSATPPPLLCETHCQKHTITDAPQTDPYHPTEGLNYFQTPPPSLPPKKQKQEDITRAGVTHWPGQISQTFSHHLIMFQYRGASIHKHFH